MNRARPLVSNLVLAALVVSPVTAQTAPAQAPIEGVVPGSLHRVSFSRAVVNLEYGLYGLRPSPKQPLRTPAPSDSLFFGSIPRSEPSGGETPLDRSVAFAVEFGAGGAMRAWCDRNRDNDLTNDPPIRLSAHPRSAQARSFLVELSWDARLGWKTYPVEETVRVVLEPGQGGRPPEARIQRVRGMLGWAEFEGVRRRVVLFDGSGDGLYSSAFGDGMFVDLDGDDHFVIEQMGPDFIPFSVPVSVGGRRYRAGTIDPVGRWVELEDLGPVPKQPVARVGEPAPSFETLTSEGAPLSLADYRGRWTILYFWGSWCGACAAQAPELVDLVKRFGPQGLEVLGVSYDTDRAKMEAFRSKYEETWPTTYSGRMLWEDPVGRLYAIDGPGVMCLITPDQRLEGKYEDPWVLRERLTEILGGVAGRWQNSNGASTRRIR